MYMRYCMGKPKNRKLHCAAGYCILGRNFVHRRTCWSAPRPWRREFSEHQTQISGIREFSSRKCSKYKEFLLYLLFICALLCNGWCRAEKPQKHKNNQPRQLSSLYKINCDKGETASCTAKLNIRLSWIYSMMFNILAGGMEHGKKAEVGIRIMESPFELWPKTQKPKSRR